MKRWWVLAALGTALLLVSSGQTWVTGTAADPVLGATRIQATGAQAGSTLTAGALLAGAALLAGLVGTRPVRLAAALCLAGGGVLAGLPVIRSLADPAAVAAAVAGDRPGAAGLALQIEDAGVTFWPWVGALGAVLVLLGAALCGLVWLRPTQPARVHPSSPASEGAAPGPAQGPAQGRGQRGHDAWDDLSRGDDPTVDD